MKGSRYISTTFSDQIRKSEMSLMQVNNNNLILNLHLLFLMCAQPKSVCKQKAISYVGLLLYCVLECSELFPSSCLAAPLFICCVFRYQNQTRGFLSYIIMQLTINQAQCILTLSIGLRVKPTHLCSSSQIDSLENCTRATCKFSSKYIHPHTGTHHCIRLLYEKNLFKSCFTQAQCNVALTRSIDLFTLCSTAGVIG